MKKLVGIVFVLVSVQLGCSAPPPTPDVSPMPSPRATDVPSAETLAQETAARGKVAVVGNVTELVPVGGEITLTLAITNVGSRDLQGLTVVVSEAYLAKMIVLDTEPSATRHNEQGGEYFLFGPLARGMTATYIIRLSPREVGEFDANIFVSEWSPLEMTPLLEAGGGEASFVDVTDVVAN